MKSKLIFGCLLLAFTASNSNAADNITDDKTYIIGHWNYPDNSVNPIYVISEGENVELFINDISNGFGRHESDHLFTFDKVFFQPGTLTAVSYDAEGKELGKHSLVTSGVPAQIKLTLLDPDADNSKVNADELILQCEITDFYGRRCLADNRTILFEIEEPAISRFFENNIEKKQLPLHNGVNLLSIKKPSKPGEIKVTAKARGLAPSSAVINQGR